MQCHTFACHNSMSHHHNGSPVYAALCKQSMMAASWVYCCLHPSGVRQRSKGPSQDEFHRATQVLFVRGRPFARRNQPSTPQQTQHAQQSQQAEHAWQIQLAGQAQHVQQAQHAQQLQGGNRQVGPGATANPQHPQAQQQQQGTLNSNRGQKRFAASEAVPALHPSKRSKNADEVRPGFCTRFTACLALEAVLHTMSCCVFANAA